MTSRPTSIGWSYTTTLLSRGAHIQPSGIDRLQAGFELPIPWNGSGTKPGGSNFAPPVPLPLLPGFSHQGRPLSASTALPENAVANVPKVHPVHWERQHTPQTLTHCVAQMEPTSNTKLLPPPPLDELLNERKRQALNTEKEDVETRRTGIDGDAITRRLILEDFDSSFLRFSEDTAGREYERKRILYCFELLQTDTFPSPSLQRNLIRHILKRKDIAPMLSISHQTTPGQQHPIRLRGGLPLPCLNLSCLRKLTSLHLSEKPTPSSTLWSDKALPSRCPQL